MKIAVPLMLAWYFDRYEATLKLKVGEQTDIWSLCVVLYELITGRRPFEGETFAAMTFALFTSVPTPTTQLGAGDDALWAIIERGLQKAPADRWPDMQSLGRALRALT